MNGTDHRATQRYRSIWISDVHLGFRGCNAELLLDFLHTVECDYLYLVGDIIDIWQINKKPFWPQSHSNVIRTLLGKAKHGTEVIYVVGNHDELLRDYHGVQFGNIKIVNQIVHIRADDFKLLVIHGDQFDGLVKFSKTLAILGSKLYDWLLQFNLLINFFRRKLGFPHWSLAAFLKSKVKNAMKYISNFEHVVAHEATRLGLDGVICGHIHRAEMTHIAEILYCNCGDWVESCTALIEHPNGQMELLNWSAKEKLPQHILKAA